MPLPTGLTYGRVVGRFILAIADSTDVDTEPDAQPATGKVKFVPAVTHILMPGASPEPVFVAPQPIECTLDSDGYLIDPNGARGVTLLASNNPNINPRDWSYSVQFNIPGVQVATFSMKVDAGVEKNLAIVSPIPTTGGTTVVVTEESRIAAEYAAQQAQAYYEALITEQVPSEVVAQAVEDYLAAHPVTGDVTQQELEDAINAIELLPGPQGIQGPIGPKGDKGDTGAAGAKGDTGNQGIQGIKGDKGDPGTPGTNGADGAPGADGEDGAPGTDGREVAVRNNGTSLQWQYVGDGAIWQNLVALADLKGPQGDQGIQGIQGVQGIPGEQGEQGETGPAGADGAPGTPAAQTVVKVSTGLETRPSTSLPVLWIAAVGYSGDEPVNMIDDDVFLLNSGV